MGRTIEEQKIRLAKIMKLAVETGNVDAINDASNAMMKHIRKHPKHQEYFYKFTKALHEGTDTGLFEICKDLCFGRFLIIDNQRIINGFDTIREAQIAYPFATIGKPWDSAE